ncbi:MAG: zinc metallopeptidase [Candidatus Hydrogenedentes bacterium]|nr:zinc metallopeptidase [Candidatus Hydrogenedentota bacterium]
MDSIEEFNRSNINVFLLGNLKGINGISFTGSNAVALADYTTVYDFRALAHEVGHAIQHARLYSPLMMRNIVYPVCNVGSTLAFPLFFIGFLFSFPALLQIGIFLFTLAVFFTVLTLPVEFNASSRAIRALASGGYLTEDELQGTRKVLSAAAMTYVAAAAMAILQLVRMIFLSNRN